MNRTELHPVDALLLVALAVLWAVAVLARAVVVPLVALLLTLAHWRPAAPPPAPLEHPLALAPSLGRAVSRWLPIVPAAFSMACG